MRSSCSSASICRVSLKNASHHSRSNSAKPAKSKASPPIVSQLCIIDCQPKPATKPEQTTARQLWRHHVSQASAQRCSRPRGRSDKGGKQVTPPTRCDAKFGDAANAHFVLAI